MTEDQIKHMVDRFLSWRLPENFSPDGGVSFKRTFNDHLPTPSKYEPSGTNLLDATQADAMVRHMVEGLALHEGEREGGYQSLSLISQEWLAKAREYEECAEQGDISPEEVCLYKTSAEILRECESKLHPFIMAGKVVIDPPKPYSNINECPYCKRMFKDGETCTRGGCPMGGDF